MLSSSLFTSASKARFFAFEGKESLRNCSSQSSHRKSGSEPSTERQHPPRTALCPVAFRWSSSQVEQGKPYIISHISPPHRGQRFGLLITSCILIPLDSKIYNSKHRLSLQHHPLLLALSHIRCISSATVRWP